jgi:uncharacterized damage-inducible protein DinB
VPLTRTIESIMNDHAANLTPLVNSAFLAQAREFLAHDYLPKIEKCLASLTDGDIWWRANEESNSIGNLLLHLSGNMRQWIVSGLGGSEDHRQRQDEFDERASISRDELLSKLRQTLAEVDDVLLGFDPDKLLNPYRIQTCEVTALEAIFHVVEHFSMHTGQIILLTKLLVKRDLNFYDFSSGNLVRTWQEPESKR